MALSPLAFANVRRLVLDRSGIVLDEGKEYLVESRLAPLARQSGFASVDDLINQVARTGFDTLHRQVVEAMTTNETTFFRDVHPFDALRKVILPELLTTRAATKTLSIWCGAASSGQEPYSIAILLREHFPQLKDWRITFLATDLSTAMLARARAGRYSQLEVNRGLPAPVLVKYFTKQGMEWHLKDDIRTMVEFRELNLVERWPVLGPFDVVFLRNVLIYFDVETKKEILGRVRKTLHPDGVLFLGGAETTMALDDGFTRVQLERAVAYRPAAAPRARCSYVGV